MRVVRIVGLLAVAALSIYATPLAYYWCLGKIATLDPNVVAAIVASVATAAVALYTQRQNKLRDIAESHRLAKVALYEDYMEFTFSVLAKSKRGGAGKALRATPELEKRFMEFNRKLIVWGSPAVIRAFSEFRSAANRGAGTELLLVVDDMFSAIRADLGNRSFGLRRGDLIKLILTDPEELDNASAR